VWPVPARSKVAESQATPIQNHSRPVCKGNCLPRKPRTEAGFTTLRTRPGYTHHGTAALTCFRLLEHAAIDTPAAMCGAACRVDEACSCRRGTERSRTMLLPGTTLLGETPAWPNASPTAWLCGKVFSVQASPSLRWRFWACVLFSCGGPGCGGAKALKETHSEAATSLRCLLRPWEQPLGEAAARWPKPEHARSAKLEQGRAHRPGCAVNPAGGKVYFWARSTGSQAFLEEQRLAPYKLRLAVCGTATGRVDRGHQCVPLAVLCLTAAKSKPLQRPPAATTPNCSVKGSMNQPHRFQAAEEPTKNMLNPAVLPRAAVLSPRLALQRLGLGRHRSRRLDRLKDARCCQL
jgi:hypothetical protein